MFNSPLLRKWFVSSPFQSIVLVYQGMALMEKTFDHCTISVDGLDCKLVLVFHCKCVEKRERVKEKDRQKEKEMKRKRQRQKQRETKWEKERNVLKEIGNDTKVEHTLLME